MLFVLFPKMLFKYVLVSINLALIIAFLPETTMTRQSCSHVYGCSAPSAIQTLPHADKVPVAMTQAVQCIQLVDERCNTQLAFSARSYPCNDAYINSIFQPFVTQEFSCSKWYVTFAKIQNINQVFILLEEQLNLNGF